MQVENTHRTFWNKYKEDGDVQKLAKLTKLHYTTISNLMTGTTTGTSTETILKINEFYKKRRAQRKRAEVDNED